MGPPFLVLGWRESQLFLRDALTRGEKGLSSSFVD